MMKFTQRERALLVTGMLSLMFTVYGWRLFQLQVLCHDELSDEVSQIHDRVVSRIGRRGQILDVKGNLLANSQTTHIVTADPSVITSNAASYARALAPLLQMSEPELLGKLTHDGQYVRLKQRVAEDTAEQIRALKLKGIQFEDQLTRYYPNNILGSHVLGFVNAEHNGVQGIEASMDAYLTGRPGYEVIERDRRGKEIRALRSEAIGPKDGYNVVLTIDQVIQSIAETELEKAVEKHHPQAAMIIVCRPKTGEILAMSCRPTFDPNHAGDATPDARRNRCIADVAEPGSTFKSVIIAGALNDAVVSLSDRFDCENGAFIYAGRALHDAHPYGVLSVEEILFHSSNIGAAKIGLKMGPARVYQYIRRFGFGQKTDIALPGEVAGIAHPLQRWNALSITRIPMGHEVAVTPIQMMLAVNAVANGGRLMRPMIIDRVVDVDGTPVIQYHPQQVAQVITPRASIIETSALRKVTGPDGTAPHAAVKGYETAGKTGTAQKLENGHYVNKYYASFIGYLPAGDPEISILVSLDDPSIGGYYGGTVAGPVFREVAERVARYLGIPPQTIEPELGNVS